MAVERWDPVRDLRQAEPDGSEAWRPLVDVWEEGDTYRVRVDLPGVAGGDITVDVEDGVLHVRGERRAGGSVPRAEFLRAERPHGRFALSMALPASVDPQGIEARQHDGVLEILVRNKRDDRASRVRVELK